MIKYFVCFILGMLSIVILAGLLTSPIMFDDIKKLYKRYKAKKLLKYLITVFDSYFYCQKLTNNPYYDGFPIKMKLIDYKENMFGNIWLKIIPANYENDINKSDAYIPDFEYIKLEDLYDRFYGYGLSYRKLKKQINNNSLDQYSKFYHFNYDKV